MKRLKAWGVFPVVVCLLVGGLVLPGKASALSLEEEAKLGKEFVADIRKQFEIVEDPYARDYINELGHYAAEAVGTSRFPFHFYLIDRNELNAFAGPGGHIFFFTGLIEAVDSVDEVAAITCHEIAHITARHLARRIDQYTKLNIATLAGMLAGILIGGEVGQAVATGSMAAGAQAQLAFSRTDERQADQLGFSYMRESGFDPSAMVRVLNRFQASEVYGTDRVPAYLRTHPMGPERMANIDSLLESGGRPLPTEKSESLRRRFPLFQALLKARYGDPDAAERAFRRTLEEDPEDPIAHFGLGLREKEDANYPAAEAHLRRAVALRPDLVPIRVHLGETYQLQGRYQDAIRVLEEAPEEDASNPKILFLLATSFQSLEQYDRAIRIFERLRAREPVEDEVFYNLGLCYGRLNRLALAHYHFGLYFKRTQKPSKARFHFERARELGQHDPALLQKIQEELEPSSREKQKRSQNGAILLASPKPAY